MMGAAIAVSLRCLILLLISVPLAGCGPANPGSARSQPVGSPEPGSSGLPAVAPTPESSPPSPGVVWVLLPGGGKIRAEVADDPEERETGLMFRETLAAGAGMLLVFPSAGGWGIWMKNCRFPLDLLWLDARGRVVALEESAPPCAAEPCELYQPDVPATTVLEVASGTARREGLRVGSQVEIVFLAPPGGRPAARPDSWKP